MSAETTTAHQPAAAVGPGASVPAATSLQVEADLDGEPTRDYRMPPLGRGDLVLFTAAAGVLLALAGVLVFRYQFFFGDALSRAFIAASVVRSGSPGITNLGFIWTPLPSIVQIPFASIPPLHTSGFSPNIPTALFAAASLVVLNRILLAWLPERRYRWPALFLYQTHPLILTYSINGMSEQIMMFLTLVCLLLLINILFEDWSYRAHLKASVMGLVAGGAFLTRYEGVSLGLTLAVLLVAGPVLLHRWRIPSEVEAAVLAYGAPFSYTVFLWVFFNWIIMGHPLHFFTGPGSNAEQAAALLESDPFIADLAGNVVGSVSYVGFLAGAVSPAVVVVVIALLSLGIWRRDAFAWVTLILLLSFPLFQVYMHLAGQSFGYMRFHIYIVPFIVTGLVYVSWRLRSHLPPAVTMSVIALLLLGSSVVNGVALFRAGVGRFIEGQLPTVIRLAETGSAEVLAEQAADPTYANARSLADALRALPEPGRILVDEQYADHLVVLSGQFGRFITSRDSDYREVIADPSKGAAYVLVGNVAAGQGILATQRPELFDIGAEGLQLAGEWPGTRVETWRLYEVTNRAAEALVPPSPASDTGQ